MNLWERYWRFQVRRIAKRVHGQPARGGGVIDAFAYGEGALACRICPEGEELLPALREDIGDGPVGSGIMVWGFHPFESVKAHAEELRSAMFEEVEFPPGIRPWLDESIDSSEARLLDRPQRPTETPPRPDPDYKVIL